MGLFSFLKKSGAKILTREKTNRVSDAETKRLEAEIAKRQKLIVLKGVVDSLGIKVRNMELDLHGDVVTVYGQTRSQAEKEKAILALGNVAGIKAVDDRLSVDKPAQESRFYTVKKGDTLSKIAKRYFGDPMKYMKIFKANQPMLKDPNKIYPGQTLRIPNR